jgi:hypothetical protein
MTKLVQAVLRDVPVPPSDFSVVSLWSLLGLALSLAVVHFGLDLTVLS